MRYIILLLAAAISLVAADATGRWSGNLIVPSDDGAEQSHPALLVLKQEGGTLTGTAGPAEDQQPFQNGTVDNGVVTFELARGESVMRFNLKQDGDEIKGDVTREREGQTQRAKLVAKREK